MHKLKTSTKLVAFANEVFLAVCYRVGLSGLGFFKGGLFGRLFALGFSVGCFFIYFLVRRKLFSL